MKKKIFLTLPFVVCILFPLLTGCLSLEKSYLEKHYFVLDASRDGEAVSSGTGVVLSVRRFQISPQFEGKSLIYRLSDSSYETDFYNEFFVSPASLLTEEVRQWLRDSGLFQNIVDPSSYLDPSHVLEGSVTALYGDYRESTVPKAVLEIHFFLLRQVSERYELIFQKQYHREEPLKGNTPDDLVRGWNNAFENILAKFETDIKTTITKD
ncbi:MAG: ABC-type transport auxiliary lipoprotein family protein [Candidatus Scalindua sp.]|nr:ABC-type transport auxiliary lipoprotein family protein [Candidatus Scalindua sp.]